MYQWPPASELKDRVMAGLNEAAECHHMYPITDWTTAIFVQIRVHLAELKCHALKNSEKALASGFCDKEFLYDFTANIYPDSEHDDLLIQTVVAGESELQNDGKYWWDFNKLLQSDAPLCFFIFHTAFCRMDASFEDLTNGIQRKQSYRQKHGLTSSAYLLSCRWGYPHQYSFKHRFIDRDGKMEGYKCP